MIIVSGEFSGDWQMLGRREMNEREESGKEELVSAEVLFENKNRR